MGSIADQPAFRPISRREIMSAVNTSRRQLGLRQGSLVVLDALLSCLACQDQNGKEAPVTHLTLLTVYASNETLCFRAKGLTDRQLRRHLYTLEKANLLRRRDSANGKRFPIMLRGKAIGAFGLDLSPLFARADELMIMAQRHREQAEELRGVRARVLQLRAKCLGLKLDDVTATFVEGVGNLMRRASLTLVEAHTVFTRLTTVISNHYSNSAVEGSELTEAITPVISATDANHSCAKPTETPSVSPEATSSLVTTNIPVAAPPTAEDMDAAKTPASDGQNVRHIEPESDTKKRNHGNEPNQLWSELTEVNAFYAAPTSVSDATVIAFEFGRMLRISRDILTSALVKISLWDLLRIEDRIAQKADTILNPDAYLKSILSTL
ncbi:helix-turn-helix domain-containing protein [Paracoccus sp. CPCC 101403]|uniref:Helix-turn-helix domain-containing protein n=1 Tax=Paracoccus broussonetiae TaxID=3075834 RepID=A0ABU3EIX7_9RHOB|nr:helix-turn-helix domain-containing protein [Paracoccus sp. CPCC 101403]MDT1064200.1 helix-turn-helix domain-containing protein [Paracoccus sp. CPCC 101403]